MERRIRPQVPAMAKMTARVCISGQDVLVGKFQLEEGPRTRENAEYFLGHA